MDRSRKTYLLETAGVTRGAAARIVGYLTFSHIGSDCLQIDEVAVDPAERGKSYGPLLVRFAENDRPPRPLSKHPALFDQ